MQLEKKLKVKTVSALPRYYLAASYQRLHQLDQSLRWYKEALALYREQNNAEGQALALYGIGGIQQSRLDYAQAIKSYEKVIAVLHAQPQSSVAANALNSLAEIAIIQDQYEKAEQYLQQSIHIAKAAQFDSGLAVYLANMGNVAQWRQDYPLSVSYYQQAIVLAEKMNMPGHVSNFNMFLARVYATWGQYPKALAILKAQEVFLQKHKLYPELMQIHLDFGAIYLKLSEYERASQYYKQALSVIEQYDLQIFKPAALNGLGNIALSTDRYDDAIHIFTEVMQIDEKHHRQGAIASSLNNIAGVYRAKGQYDIALDHLYRAIDIFKQLDKPSSVAMVNVAVADILRMLGQYEQALAVAATAQDVFERTGERRALASILHEIGMIKSQQNKDTDISAVLTQALKISQALNDQDLTIKIKLSFAVFYLQRQNYTLASENLKQVIEQSKAIKTPSLEARAIHYLGNIEFEKNHYTQAIGYFLHSLAINKKLTRKREAANDLTLLGQSYKELHQYDKAESYLLEAISLKEEIRLTAKGGAKRDYLASQIVTYEQLVSNYVSLKQYGHVFEAIELSRAKALLAQLSLGEKVLKPTLTAVVKENLHQDEAVLVYANSRLPELVQVVLSTEVTHALEQSSLLDGSDSLQSIITEYRAQLTRPISGGASRGFFVQPKVATHSKARSQKQLSQLLYQKLIKPIEPLLAGKNKLIIVPDGLLAFLPFETLMDEAGVYLGVKFQITYTQSMGVLDAITSRPKVSGKLPVMAFGGAVYERPFLHRAKVVNNAQIKHLSQKIAQKNQHNESILFAYDALGISGWSPLPGTVQEVNHIGRVMPKATLFRGRKVTESNVKSLSKQGKLKDYRVIHFATHGIVVPEIPELSSIVLSQFTGDHKEDGYLSLSEIAKLKLAADFVNLSACETGLGRVYGGEGVVGLNSAFLAAGAQAVSSSLWTVSDTATNLFMSQLYTLVERDKMSYAAAMAEVKRGFIRGEHGDEMKHPFYWSAFVYYGVSH